MNSASFSLAVAVVAVPFGNAAGYALLGAFLAAGTAYLASRRRGRPFPFLNYSGGGFLLFLSCGLILVYPLWLAVFMLMIAPMAYIFAWFK